MPPKHLHEGSGDSIIEAKRSKHADKPAPKALKSTADHHLEEGEQTSSTAASVNPTITGGSSAMSPGAQSGDRTSESSDELSRLIASELATGLYYTTQDTVIGDGHANDEDAQARAEQERDYSEAAIATWKKEMEKSKKGKAPMPKSVDASHSGEQIHDRLPVSNTAHTLKDAARQLPKFHELLKYDADSFVSRTIFESDDRPVEIADYGYMRVNEGEPKLNAAGRQHKDTISRLKHKTSGMYILPSTITHRPSATEKYITWQKSGHADRAAQKAKRDITLIEHEPDGKVGEPDRWAAKLGKSTWKFDIPGKPLSNGSRFTIRVDVSDIRLNANGLAKNWHNALQLLAQENPQVTIIVEDDSILTSDPSKYYPKDTVDVDCSTMSQQNFHDRAMIITQTPDLNPDDPDQFKEGVERIRATNRALHIQQCADIDENIREAQAFVDAMRRLRRYVTSSPVIEIRSTASDHLDQASSGAGAAQGSGASDDPLQLD